MTAAGSGGAADEVQSRSKAQKATKKDKPLTPHDRYKLSIADELGLGEKVRRVGWGGLSAAETGRIGGYMTKKARAKDKAAQDHA